jgi:SAM-dependent methyltransferase
VTDALAFRSDLLPTEHFDRRFSEENLTFWVPLLVEWARISPGVSVLDVGCGTGGFSRAIAASTGARVTGLDASEKFVEHARRQGGAVEWVLGDAEALPFARGSFDRVLLSLVLHQLADPLAAVREAFSVLRPDGLAVVRTIAPEDVADRIPERYLPTMAAADAARLPRIEQIERWLEEAGFERVETTRVLRNKRLSLAEAEQDLLGEVRGRYAFISDEELAEGLRRLRGVAASAGAWIDPRPTYFVVASRV